MRFTGANRTFSAMSGPKMSLMVWTYSLWLISRSVGVDPGVAGSATAGAAAKPEAAECTLALSDEHEVSRAKLAHAAAMETIIQGTRFVIGRYSQPKQLICGFQCH